MSQLKLKLHWLLFGQILNKNIPFSGHTAEHIENIPFSGHTAEAGNEGNLYHSCC